MQSAVYPFWKITRKSEPRRFRLSELGGEGAPDTVLVGGMDLYTATVYRLPGFSLRTCGSEIGIDNMIVETAENGPSLTEQSGDGVLGMDFIRQFRKVTINFSQMYVAAEK